MNIHRHDVIHRSPPLACYLWIMITKHNKLNCHTSWHYRPTLGIISKQQYNVLYRNISQWFFMGCRKMYQFVQCKCAGHIPHLEIPKVNGTHYLFAFPSVDESIDYIWPFVIQVWRNPPKHGNKGKGPNFTHRIDEHQGHLGDCIM